MLRARFFIVNATLPACIIVPKRATYFNNGKVALKCLLGIKKNLLTHFVQVSWGREQQLGSIAR